MLHFKDYALTQCANKDRDSQKDSQIFQHKNFIGNFAKEYSQPWKLLQEQLRK